MSDDRKDLPPVTSPNFLEKVREALQTYLGNRGNKLDRGLTLRDLADAGIVDVNPRYLAGSGGGVPPVGGAGSAVAGAYEPDLTPPPMPTLNDLPWGQDEHSVTAAISNLLIECDAPTYAQGNGHAKSRLYGAKWVDGDLPVFANAVQLTEFTGAVGSYATDPATTWHLWLTWVTRDGVESAVPAGGTNGFVVTTGQDVKPLLDVLAGEITESQLHADLGARIDLIDGLGAGSVNARIATESAARVAALAAEEAARMAAIATEATARANALAVESQARVNAIAAEANTRLLADAQEAANRSEAIAAATLAESQDRSAAIAAAQTSILSDVDDIEASIRADLTAADATLASSLTTSFQNADASTLADAKAYTYSQASIDGSLSGLSATLTANFTAGDAAALASAKDYAYSKSEANAAIAAKGSELTTAFTNADNATLASAQSYTYSKSAIDSAITSASTTLSAAFAAADATTLASAQSYAYSKAQTDSAIAANGTTLTTAFTAADAATLASANNFTYSKSSIDTAISSVEDALRAEYTGADAATLASAQNYTYSKATIDASDAATLSTLRAEFTAADVVNLALAQNYTYAQATIDSAIATSASTLRAQLTGGSTETDINNLSGGLLYQERIARAAQDSALSQQITLLSAGAGEQFDYSNIWYFDSDAEGWTADTTTSTTVSSLAGWLRMVATTGTLTGRKFQSPAALGVDGAMYPQVRLRLRKVGTPVWVGRLYFITTADAVWNTTKSVVMTEPTYDANGIGLLTFNMPVGWTSATIAQLRFEASTNITTDNYFELDWAAVGRPSPGASSAQLAAEELARATADSAETSARLALEAVVNDKASASAVETLATRVTSVEGVNTSQGSSITTLNNSVATLTTGLAAKADATALTALTTRVTSAEGVNTSQGTSITTLTNNLSTLTNTVNTKASASALTDLTTRVTNAEGVNTSQGTSITTLNNNVTALTGTVNTKADATALTALTTRVTDAEGVNTTQSGNITTLANSLTTLTDTVNTKAAASALNDLATRVTEAEGVNTSQASSITSLNSSLTTTNTNVTAAQTAATNAATLAGSKGKVLVQSTTPATADRLAQNLWIDTTSNANTPKRWDGLAWVAVTDKVATDAAAAAAAAQATANLKADVTALNALTTTVAGQGSNITAHGTRLTSLEATVNNATTGVAATANALDAVETLVNNATTGVAASATRLSSLETTVNHATTGLASKASVGYVDTAKADAISTAASATQMVQAQLDTGGATQLAIAAAASAASAAQTTANTAVTNAATAQTAANNAQTTANTASANATTANTALTNLASDNILSPVEKPSVVQDYAVITGEQAGIDAQATAYAITTEKTNYDAAVAALTTYLGTLSGWNTVPGADVVIVGTTFRSKFSDVYTKRQLLLNAISAKAKVLANAAQTQANTATTNAATAQAAANAAQTQANTATTNAATAQTTANTAVTNAAAVATRTTALETAVNSGTTGLATKASIAYVDQAEADAISSAAATTAQVNARLNAGGDTYTAITNVTNTASTKSANFVQATAPTATRAGDLWIDTANGNLLKRWSGTAWLVADDQRIGSTATSLTTLQSTVTTNNNTLTSAIQTEATTRASQTGELFAQYTVKLDVDGKVSGFGLASTGPTGAGSVFEIRVDKLVVAPASGGAAGFMPFQVLTAPTLIDGVTLPAGAYASKAFIQDLQVTNAKIANLAVDDAKIANLNVDKLVAGSLKLGSYIQSSDYTAGPAGLGYRIDRDTVVLPATSIRGLLAATQIDTRGLEIRDSSNNVILSSGSSLSTQINNVLGGGNMVANSDLMAGGEDWQLTWNQGGGTNYTGPVIDVAGASWAPAAGRAISFVRSGSVGAASGYFDISIKKNISVLPNTRYEASGYLASHRSYAGLSLVMLDSAGAYITEVYYRQAVTDNGGQNLANWDRPGGFFTTPSNCTQIRFGVRAEATTSSDPYTWATRFFLAQAGAAQVALSPWSAGGVTGAFGQLDKINIGNASTYIADLAVNTIKLANNSITRSAVTSGQYTASTSIPVPIGDAFDIFIFVRAVPRRSNAYSSSYTDTINLTVDGQSVLYDQTTMLQTGTNSGAYPGRSLHYSVSRSSTSGTVNVSVSRDTLGYFSFVGGVPDFVFLSVLGTLR